MYSCLVSQAKVNVQVHAELDLQAGSSKNRERDLLLPKSAMLFRHHARGCGQTLDISLAAPPAGTSRSPFLPSLSGGQGKPKGTQVSGQGAARLLPLFLQDLMQT